MLKFEVGHTLSKDEALTRARKLLDYWGKKHGVVTTWNGDTATLSGKVMGISLGMTRVAMVFAASLTLCAAPVSRFFTFVGVLGLFAMGSPAAAVFRDRRDEPERRWPGIPCRSTASTQDTATTPPVTVPMAAPTATPRPPKAGARACRHETPSAA